MNPSAPGGRLFPGLPLAAALLLALTGSSQALSPRAGAPVFRGAGRFHGPALPRQGPSFSSQRATAVGEAAGLKGLPKLPGSLIPPNQAPGFEGLVFPVRIQPAVRIPPASQALGFGARSLDSVLRESAELPVLAGLAFLADGLSGELGGAKAFGDSRPLGEFFDNSRPGDGDVPSSGEEPSSPKLPPGILSVSVDEVRALEDVERLIPSWTKNDPNDPKLKLKGAVQRMAPYHVQTYHDAYGGFFVAIDLSRNPDLVHVLPEQESHEVKLIKKIQLWTKDLQVVVREEGKTPDLVLAGRVTELKSLMGKEVDLTFLVNKANNQVLEHALRHGLGPGAAAVDLTEESQVPVAEILSSLDAWQALPDGSALPKYDPSQRVKGKVYKGFFVKQRVYLEKIFVFAGLELKVFVRQADGTFRVEEPGAMPFAWLGLDSPFQPCRPACLPLPPRSGSSSLAALLA